MKEMLAEIKRTLRHGMMNQSGQSILVMVLVLLVVGALMMGPLLGFMSTGLKSGQMHESRLQEFYAADSGVEDGIRWLMGGRETEGWHWTWNEEGFWQRETYSMNDRDVYVTVEALAANDTYAINSIATSADGSTTVLCTAWVITWFYGDAEFDNQNPPPSGKVHVDGDVTLEGNIQFTGTLTASGDVTSMNNVNVTGSFNIMGDVILENSAELTGTLCCGGNITLGNNCAITGEIRVYGDDCTITLAQPESSIAANIWADGNLTIDIQIGSTSTEIVGDIYAPDGDVSIYLTKNNSEMQGDIWASRSIEVSGIGSHNGTATGNYTGEPPFPMPQCPDFPPGPADIETYEIT
jgi:hypothetical protein